jgi:osmoprotectant transport system substrate-binding protein/osmoprotectant transport system permease protein
VSRPLVVLALVAASLCASTAHAEGPALVAVGSKAFPESWILGDALVLLLGDGGAPRAEHHKNLGGTEIAYQALASGDIDVYPEYTGTIGEVILKAKEALTPDEMQRRLAEHGLAMSPPLGFNDGYALAVSQKTAASRGLTRISDLARAPDLRLGFTHEFLGRPDGYPGLAARYGLSMPHVTGLQHELSYEAIAHDQIDVMEIYTTDPQIEQLSLVLLADDKGFFPRYDAVLLYRLDLSSRVPGALDSILELAGTIDERTMMRANAAVALRKESSREAARDLIEAVLPRKRGTLGASSSALSDVAHNTARHLLLVASALFAATLLGVPLGILATRSRPLAFLSISSAGLVQTIPSLALLAFLIPIFGIGVVPALVALFIYGLLPIVRGTYTGIRSIPPALDEAADALGLTPYAKLRHVELPMASRAILSGIRTSAIITVGTATLAALIGAEGLGNPIMQGIALRDTSLILEGAVPAALLALAVEGGFQLAERFVIPRGLTLAPRT